MSSPGAAGAVDRLSPASHALGVWWWARIFAVACSTAAVARGQPSPPAEKARPGSPSVRLERPAPSPDESLRKTLRDEAERRRVKEGRIHPRLHDIERTATDAFNPTWSMVADHPRKIGSIGKTMSAMGKSVLRSWMTMAPKYATNRPPPERPRHPSLERPGEEDDPTLLETYDEQARQTIDHANALSAEVCLDLKPGAEPKATIVRTSGRGKFDKMVRDSAMVAALTRPYPPDAPAVRACYRFTARFATMPPLPFLSCSLEKPTRSDSRCIYPFKRVIGKDVELISVD